MAEDKKDKAQTTKRGVVVRDKYIREDLREKIPAPDTLDIVLNPFGSAADALQRKGREVRDTTGNEIAANALIAAGGAVKFGEAVRGGPRALAGVATTMLVDHANNENRVIGALAKDGYPTGDKSDNGRRNIPLLEAEYKRFKKEMDAPTYSNNKASEVAGLVGAFALNTAASAPLVARGGRTINRFADMIHAKGNVAEFKALDKIADQNHGSMHPVAYIRIKEYDLKHPGTNSIPKLAEALKSGGSSREFLEELKRGKADKYVADTKQAVVTAVKDKEDNLKEVEREVKKFGGSRREYNELNAICKANGDKDGMEPESYRMLREAFKGKEIPKQLFAESVKLSGSSAGFILAAEENKIPKYIKELRDEAREEQKFKEEMRDDKPQKPAGKTNKKSANASEQDPDQAIVSADQAQRAADVIQGLLDKGMLPNANAVQPSSDGREIERG